MSYTAGLGPLACQRGVVKVGCDNKLHNHIHTQMTNYTISLLVSPWPWHPFLVSVIETFLWDEGIGPILNLKPGEPGFFCQGILPLPMGSRSKALESRSLIKTHAFNLFRTNSHTEISNLTVIVLSFQKLT